MVIETCVSPVVVNGWQSPYCHLAPIRRWFASSVLSKCSRRHPRRGRRHSIRHPLVRFEATAAATDGGWLRQSKTVPENNRQVAADSCRYSSPRKLAYRCRRHRRRHHSSRHHPIVIVDQRYLNRQQSISEVHGGDRRRLPESRQKQRCDWHCSRIGCGRRSRWRRCRLLLLLPFLALWRMQVTISRSCCRWSQLQAGNDVNNVFCVETTGDAKIIWQNVTLIAEFEVVNQSHRPHSSSGNHCFLFLVVKITLGTAYNLCIIYTASSHDKPFPSNRKCNTVWKKVNLWLSVGSGISVFIRTDRESKIDTCSNLR